MKNNLADMLGSLGKKAPPKSFNTTSQSQTSTSTSSTSSTSTSSTSTSYTAQSNRPDFKQTTHTPPFGSAKQTWQNSNSNFNPNMNSNSNHQHQFEPSFSSPPDANDDVDDDDDFQVSPLSQKLKDSPRVGVNENQKETPKEKTNLRNENDNASPGVRKSNSSSKPYSLPKRPSFPLDDPIEDTIDLTCDTTVITKKTVVQETTFDFFF